MKNSKLTTLQLMLMSTGGMIRCGWLFSPYYVFQTVGVGILLSWIIVAALTLIIALAFAEVSPFMGAYRASLREIENNLNRISIENAQ